MVADHDVYLIGVAGGVELDGGAEAWVALKARTLEVGEVLKRRDA
jgi:hypothetical protein